MEREIILKNLAEIVRETLDIPAARVAEDMSLVHDLELDSLLMVRIAVAAEDRFGVTLSDEDTWALHTVADAVTFIERALEHTAARAPRQAAGTATGGQDDGSRT
ncbi:acyl carrier protein [Streptomyces sp. NPDC045456]|uniref:acyl carrier protein n=1 Tax=Streptomyces sp. NPDC045456 TaxID=3155254 RepID=UPI0033F45DC4